MINWSKEGWIYWLLGRGAVSVQEIERVIDFDLRHLVSKVTDERDYISRDKRIEGHRQSIAQAIHALITRKLKGQDNEDFNE